MDKAKEAVSKIIGRSGHHDTEIDETVNPAVTSETVKPHRHETTQEAVDREVHQDHYHTTVQPLKHEEILPEKHTHQQAPVQEREFHHGDLDTTKRSVEAEAAQFADTSRTAQTTVSQSQAPTATGEHVHHHVHENVQPVVHKTTHQPEVVHTTVPIHETHHAQAEHHGMSVLPTKTLDEFKSLGGAVTGAGHRHEEYEGHPRPYNPELQATRSPADNTTTGTTGTTGGLTGTSGHHSHHHGAGTTGTTGGLTGTTGTTGTTGGLTDTSGHHTGTTGGLSGTSASNVSGIGHTGTDYRSGAPGTTGTALGGRTEGNTATRAMDAVTHGSTGVGSSHTGTGVGTSASTGIGSESTAGRGLEHSSTGHGHTSGITGQHDRDHADRLSSTNPAESDTTRGVSDDVQSPRQGKDPNLVETNAKSGNWKGEGVPGSHSAVFGLTPDGKTHEDTAHGVTALRPAHTKSRDTSATRDAGSRAPVGGGVAEQMDDPGVLRKGHGGPNMTDSGTAKPGAGAPGGEQGFGQIRPQDHGSEDKIKDKLDPTTDADRDGKRGIMD